MVLRMKLGFFSAEQVCHLAKISDTQLRYWHQTNINLARSALPTRSGLSAKRTPSVM